MFYINSYSFCLTCIYFTIIQSSATSKASKHVYYKIDEFIKQLMTSKKFEELADTIAEKAAQKIRDMDLKNEATLRHSNNKTKNTALRTDDKSKNTEVKYQRDEKNKTPKLGKINTEVFLKEYFSSKELLLNFKHLTRELAKSIKRKQPKEEKDSSEDNKSENNKNSSETSREKDTSENDKHEKESDGMVKTKHSGPKFSEESINEDETHENSAFHEKKKQQMHHSVSEEIQVVDNSDTTNEETNQSKLDSDSNFKNSPIQRITKLKANDSETDFNSQPLEDNDDTEKKTTSNTLKVEKKRYSSSEMKRSTKNEKEIIEVGINRALSDDNKLTNENFSAEKSDIENVSEEQSDNETVSKEEAKNDNRIPKYKNKVEKTKSKKQVIRKENGKFYTYLSSPDYAEYHEAMAELPIKKKYINTYQ